MEEKKKSWLKSPWTISITTAVISFSLTLLRDILKKIPVLSTINTIFEWVYNLIYSFLIFEVKMWWILLIIALIVIIIIILIYYISNNVEENNKINPDYLNYTSDVLKKWTWTWDYKYNYHKKKWIISDLEAHCPICDTILIERSSTHFECPRCDYYAFSDKSEDPYKIEMLIIDNIKRRYK